MPVSFSSPPRNLFLLGSSGADVVRNFFHEIDKSSGTDDVYIPDEIRYDYNNDRYNLAGTAQDSNSKEFGWLERRNYDPDLTNIPSVPTSTEDWSVKIESTLSNTDTTLRAMESYGNDLVVVGKTGQVPWIAKYNNNGSIDWQSTTNSANVEYTGVCSDGTNYYACGNTPDTGSNVTNNQAIAFVEKFDSNGNPSWGKSATMLGRDVVLEKISANNRGEVIAVGYLEDDTADKGYIVKIDTSTGEILWDRTLERNISGSGGSQSNDGISAANVRCTATYIDGNDLIYVVGSINGVNPVNNGVGEFIVKYSPEGNILWQRENNTDHYTNLDGAPNMIPFDVKSDTDTQQTVVLSVQDQGSFALNNSDIFISKYSKDGSLVFRRKISKGNNNLGAASLDADPSFYFVLFRDQQVVPISGTPDRYFFGKVSTSGNGLGNFQYDDGGSTPVDYTIVTNAESKIGRLSDGSVRNDSSDFITYPFSANKLVFDDFATPVSNKKKQMDSADSFEYSGSPAVRPPDFTEFSFGYSQSGRDWYDLSGYNRNGKTVITEPYLGWGSVTFDGLTDRLTVGALLPTSTGTAFTVEFFWRSTSNTSQRTIWAQHSFSVGRTAYFVNNGDAFLVSQGNVIGNFAYSNNRWYFTRITYTAGGAIEVFVDGVSQGTGTQTVGVDNTTFAIGSMSTGGADAFNGYISNFRVVIGSALDGTEVPTEPLTRILGTKLLTCQGDTIRDGGEDVLSITVHDNAVVTADGATWNNGGWWEFQTNPGSVAPFTGTAIDLPRDYSPDLLASGFTSSWWQRGITTPGQVAQFVVVQGLMQIGNGDGQQSWRVERNNSTANTIEFGVMDGVTFSNNELISSNFPDGEWIHVTIKWDGTKQYIYKNGVLDTERTFVGTPTHQVGGTVRIGSRQIGAPYPYNGDLSEFRLWSRSLTNEEIFQDFNSTKSKFINEAPDTAPKIGSGIVYGSDLTLNYDFGNRACYDRAENLFKNNNFADLEDYSSTDNGEFSFNKGPTNSTRGPNVLSPVGDLTGGTIVYDGTNASAGGIAWAYKDLTASGDQNQVQFSDGDIITYSVYAKIGSSNNAIKGIYLRTYSPETAHGFYLDSGTKAGGFNENTAAAGISADIVDAGNGWYRCSITLSITANDEIGFQLYLTNAGGATGFNDASGAGDTIHAWGAQVERLVAGGIQGPTRFIKTSGTAITAPTTVKNLASSSFTGTINGATLNLNQNLFNGVIVEKTGSFDFGSTSNQHNIVTTGNCSSILGSGNASVECWVKLDDVLTRSTILSGYNSGDAARWDLEVDTGKIYFIHHANGQTEQGAPGIGLNWTHVAVTRIGTSIQIYINGTANGNSNLGGSLGSGVPLGLGMRADGSTNFPMDGKIAEVRCYTKALTAAEVSQNYNATRSKYGV